MDRRKTLATIGAISLTASAAVVALGSSMGLFGLTDTNPHVGKLSPIDATQPTTSNPPDDLRTIILGGTVPNPIQRAAADDDHRGDDRARSSPSSSPGRDDDRGPGSASAGHDGDDD
jgi:hypothetical protein